MTTQLPTFKIFDLYDLTEIKVEDPGLKAVINLKPFENIFSEYISWLIR